MILFQESKFLNSLIFLTKFFITAVEKSRTFGFAAKIAVFLENSFFNSKIHAFLPLLLRLYPRRIWGIFDLANARIKSKIDIFNPIVIFPLVYLAFVSLSSYRPTNLGLFSIVVGIFFFAAGCRLSNRIKIKNTVLESGSGQVAILLLFIGVLALVYDLFQAGAVPLLKPAAKRHLNVTLTMLSMILVPGGILAISSIGRKMQQGKISLNEARVYSLAILLSTTFLIALLGYRTQIIVSLLGCSIAMHCSKVMGVTEVLASFFLAISSISLVGYTRSLAEGSSISLTDVLGSRIGLTLSIYDSLVNRFFFWGANHGTTLLATVSSFFHFIPGPRLGPRTIVARMYGVQDISMTSTLFGTVVLDFGIIGIMAFALLLGFVIGLSYYAMKNTKGAIPTGIFSLLLAYTIVGIETGLVDLIVFIFFFTSFLILTTPKKVA